eukprot:2798987-Prymnesium_polylepis.1
MSTVATEAVAAPAREAVRSACSARTLHGQARHITVYVWQVARVARAPLEQVEHLPQLDVAAPRVPQHVAAADDELRCRGQAVSQHEDERHIVLSHAVCLLGVADSFGKRAVLERLRAHQLQPCGAEEDGDAVELLGRPLFVDTGVACLRQRWHEVLFEAPLLHLLQREHVCLQQLEPLDQLRKAQALGQRRRVAAHVELAVASQQRVSEHVPRG